MKIEIVNWAKYNPRTDVKNTTWFRLENTFWSDQVIFLLDNDAKMVWFTLLALASQRMSGVVDVEPTFVSAVLRVDVSKVTTTLEHLKVAKKIVYVTSRARNAGVTSTCSQEHVDVPPPTYEQDERTNSTDTTAEQEVALSPPGNEPMKPESEPPKAEPEPETFTARQFVDAWNEHRGSLAEVKRLTASRADKIKTRRKEEPELAYWVACIKRMAASEFLTGKNPRGWIVDIEWLTENDTNHVKVSEGKYDNRAGKAAAEPNRDASTALRIEDAETIKKLLGR